MSAANEFARQAIAIGQMAQEATPPEGDKYEHARKLAVYHLRAAAKQLRDISEDMARLEPVK